MNIFQSWRDRRKARAAGAELDPTPDSVGMLLALNRMTSSVYAGTVPAHVIRQRRAKNRMARKSRRANRR